MLAESHQFVIFKNTINSEILGVELEANIFRASQISMIPTFGQNFKKIDEIGVI